MADFPWVHRDRVRFRDCDAMGHVNHAVFFRYVDRPGIIGRVGTIFGEAGINIATMDVGRRAQGGEALMVLTVDSEVPATVLERVATAIEANHIRAVSLV